MIGPDAALLRGKLHNATTYWCLAFRRRRVLVRVLQKYKCAAGKAAEAAREASDVSNEVSADSSGDASADSIAESKPLPHRQPRIKFPTRRTPDGVAISSLPIEEQKKCAQLLSFKLALTVT
jgi:hypothetical protein